MYEQQPPTSHSHPPDTGAVSGHPDAPAVQTVGDAPQERWAQWSYASFDRGDGNGGWQIKELRGNPDAAELAALSSRIVTAFESHEPLPEYPTHADIAAQPRRLSYGRLQIPGRPAAVYAHAVQAGSDSTGRPGNVFTHGVIDRSPGLAGPAWRPIELWRSFDWLVPYGADEVLAADLPAMDTPQPSGLVGRDLVLDFLFDPAVWRIGTLCVLMDAVAARLRGGQPVVLAVSSPDEAAQWIAAVSLLMAPSTARELGWSVYERASRLRALWEREVHIACVPLADAPRVPTGCVLLRGDETPQLGQRGAVPHRTGRGDAVEAEEWSELAQELLLDRATAEACLAGIDAIAARTAGLTPDAAWPLAMHVLESAGQTLSGEAIELARSVALRRAPSGMITDDGLRRLLIRALTGSAEEGTPELLRATETARAHSNGHETALLSFARDAYLRAALADEAWLTAPTPPAAPAGMRHLDDAAADAFISAIDADPSESDDPSERSSRAVRVLRIADLAARCGAAGHNRLRSALVVALARDAVPALANPQLAEAVVRETGQLSPMLRERFLPFALEAARGALASTPPGRIFASETLAWVTGADTPASLLAALADPLAPRGILEREVIIDHMRRGERIAGLALTTAAILLGHYGSWDAIPDEERIVDPTRLWRPGELAAVERAFPGALPREFFEPTIACASEDDEILALAGILAARAVGAVAVLARIVLAAGQPQPLPPATVRATVTELYAAYGAALRITRFAPAMLDAALRSIASASEQPPWRQEELDVLRALSSPECVTASRTALMQRVTSPEGPAPLEIALAALGTGERPPVPTAAEHIAVLGELADPLDTARDPARLLDRLAAEALTAQPMTPAELERQLLEAATRSGMRQESARSVRAWLRDVRRMKTRRNGKEP